MNLNKTYYNLDPKLKYCFDHSYQLHPIQKKLIDTTLNHPMNIMLGAPEVIQTCTCFLEQINAKYVLDIGTFTGFSALSWALVLPENGRVITMDVQGDDFMKYGEKFIKEAGLADKIDLRIKSALDTLDELIASGQSGQFDFAFIDADKTEYPQYYEKSLQLLRPGGFIAIDNALWFDRVLNMNDEDESTMAIDGLNKKIASDSRVSNILLPIGDGLHLVFKK